MVEGWAGGLPQFAPPLVERITGVPAARIEELARLFALSPRAVAIIGGPALAQSNALSQALAVNALNALVRSVGVPGGVQFTPPLPGNSNKQAEKGGRSRETASRPEAKALSAFAAEVLGAPTSPIDAVLIDDANPVFLSPKSWRVREALERVPFIASFGGFLDDTSTLADLILPDHSFLESSVDAVPQSGATTAAAGVAAPAMRPLYATRVTPMCCWRWPGVLGGRCRGSSSMNCFASGFLRCLWGRMSPIVDRRTGTGGMMAASGGEGSQGDRGMRVDARK